MSKNNLPLHRAGRNYVDKLIRMREAMIKNDCNYATLAPGIAAELKRLLNFWKYDSNEKMASFIYRHSAEIMYLIPGNKGHHSLMNEFEELYQLSDEIMNHATVC